MSGGLLLLIGTILTLAELALGFVLSRGVNQQVGRMVMLGAPLTFILLACLACLAFGWFPVEGIEPIAFN